VEGGCFRPKKTALGRVAASTTPQPTSHIPQQA
jgi:hypothetical protein